MNMKRLYFVLAAVLIAGVLVGVGGTKVIESKLALPLAQSNIKPTEDQIKKQLELYKELNGSPIAKITRSILNVVVATNTRARISYLSNPPFKKLSESLTDVKLASKFFVISGQEIPDVGAHIYITFIGKPDAIYRVAYQATRSTTTPFIVTSFEKTDDKAETIASFLKPLEPYLNDPGMTQ